MLRLAGQLNGCARNGHQIAGLNGQARRRLGALHLNGCPGANLTVLIAGRAAIDTCNGSGVETCLAKEGRKPPGWLAYLPACCSLATLTTSSVFSFSSSRSPLGVLASSGSPLNCQLMLGNGLPSASHSSTKDLPSLIVWFCGAIKISGKSVKRANAAGRVLSDFSSNSPAPNGSSGSAHIGKKKSTTAAAAAALVIFLCQLLSSPPFLTLLLPLLLLLAACHA